MQSFPVLECREWKEQNAMLGASPHNWARTGLAEEGHSHGDKRMTRAEFWAKAQATEAKLDQAWRLGQLSLGGLSNLTPGLPKREFGSLPLGVPAPPCTYLRAGVSSSAFVYLLTSMPELLLACNCLPCLLEHQSVPFIYIFCFGWKNNYSAGATGLWESLSSSLGFNRLIYTTGDSSIPCWILRTYSGCLPVG